MFNHTFIKRSLAVALTAAAGAFPAAAQAAHIVQPANPTASSASVPSVGPSLAVAHQLDQLQGNARQVLVTKSADVPSAGPGLAVAHQLDQLQGNARLALVTKEAPSGLPSSFLTDASSGGYTSVPSSAPVVSLSPSDSGFQWGDAGIGAAGAIVLMGAAAVGTGATRRRRTVIG